jgi:hypothetical protein
MLDIREPPPFNAKMSTVSPMGGDARDPGAPTTHRENVDGGALGR